MNRPTLESVRAALRAPADNIAPSIVNHPSMMSIEEKRALYNLAKLYRGDGIILDAGLFLGASTVAFAEALRESGVAGDGVRPIQSFDIAIWVKSMNSHLRNTAVQELLERYGAPEVGASFANILSAIAEPYRDLVDLHIGDIRKTLLGGTPVWLAFYDCLKSAELDQFVYRTVARDYDVGTIIIHQDYFYDRAAALKIRQEALSDYFDFAGGVGASAVFVMKERIPDALIENDPVKPLTVLQRIAMLDKAVKRAETRQAQIYTMLCLCEFAFQNGEQAIARNTMSDAKKLAKAGDGDKPMNPRVMRRLREIELIVRSD